MQLRADVFMARPEGQYCFLDVGRGRYFAPRGAGALDDAEGGAFALALRAAGLLAPEGEAGRAFSPTTYTIAQSAWDDAAGGDLGALACLAALPRVLLAWHVALRRHREETFAAIIEGRRTQRIAFNASALDARSSLDCARQFRVLSTLILRRDRCMAECLALLSFLGRAGGGADWVFAVSAPPVRAHCWVQLGDCLLRYTILCLSFICITLANQEFADDRHSPCSNPD